jgi:hypothetical protein
LAAARISGGVLGRPGHQPVEFKNLYPGWKLESRTAKSVGGKHIGPGPDIIRMNAEQNIRMFQAETFRVLPRFKPPGLKHGAHGSVKKKAGSGPQPFSKS